MDPLCPEHRGAVKAAGVWNESAFYKDFGAPAKIPQPGQRLGGKENQDPAPGAGAEPPGSGKPPQIEVSHPPSVPRLPRVLPHDADDTPNRLCGEPQPGSAFYGGPGGNTEDKPRAQGEDAPVEAAVKTGGKGPGQNPAKRNQNGEEDRQCRNTAGLERSRQFRQGIVGDGGS
ncbi:hypothetical protein FACS1894137_06860 [Spirochaetia bacterium]|nr:hypothetical protein FACS1894137_06860 [Spirochaetia bacterium]